MASFHDLWKKSQTATKRNNERYKQYQAHACPGPPSSCELTRAGTLPGKRGHNLLREKQQISHEPFAEKTNPNARPNPG
eukprot:11225360-Lingulodinium_polyedra.AAC.1